MDLEQITLSITQQQGSETSVAIGGTSKKCGMIVEEDKTV